MFANGDAPPSYEEAMATSASDASSVCLHFDTNFAQLSSLTEFKANDNTRTPIDLIAVIDVSSSMNSEVTGVLECQGYTRLDIVKHAMNVILGNLSEHDFVTVITFSSVAEVFMNRHPMTKENVKSAQDRIAEIRAFGTTNLYDGLHTAYRYLRLNPLEQRDEQFINRHIMVLTDGAPNGGPDHGKNATNIELYKQMIESECQKSFLAKHTLLHVFGITYNELDNALLGKIANIGHGMYGFISDPAIITPCFINILAQWFNMMYTGLILKDSTTERFVPWILQKGPVDLPITGHSGLQLISNTNRPMRLKFEKAELAAQSSMCSLRLAIGACFLYCRDVRASVGAALMTIDQRATQFVSSEWLDMLKYDIDIYNRIQNSSLNLWADKCLHSLALSLCDDYVTNGYEKSFKAKSDPRLLYWIEQVENVAKKISPPNPSIKPYAAATRPQTTYSDTMSYFSSSYGKDFDDGCIDGDCLVTMADETLKRVADIQIGDRVITNTNVIGTVRCVIAVPSAQLIELPGGLRLTSMHPIWCEEKSCWILPKDHPQAKVVYLNMPVDMYSFLLDVQTVKSDAMLINGRWVVHFAHDSEDPVLKHAFYGSQKMRDTVERLDPERRGKVKVTNALRDEHGVVYEYEGYSTSS